MSELLFPSPGDLPNPITEFASPAFPGRCFTTVFFFFFFFYHSLDLEPPGKSLKRYVNKDCTECSENACFKSAMANRFQITCQIWLMGSGCVLWYMETSQMSLGLAAESPYWLLICAIVVGEWHNNRHTMYFPSLHIQVIKTRRDFFNWDVLLLLLLYRYNNNSNYYYLTISWKIFKVPWYLFSKI